ncbi:PilZ domain-containing protein [Pendulispora rubella]|uniref:PilZ domain-containing protein n=1 Tax=Pendulispora rubella TaxID=2741070 RepID=A0ABZ2KUW9_9BACT
MKNRRSLTPMQGVPVDGTPLRRSDVRREVSERIQLRKLDPNAPPDTDPAAGPLLDGWALNVSRGGIRCILEESVELGDEFEITIGEVGNAPMTRRGRIVWVQEEADGLIVGVEFLTPSGTAVTEAAAAEAAETPEI